MGSNTTKTYQNHSPFSVGATPKAIGFCGGNSLFVEQRSTANYYTPYKFSGKEKDEETSYSYFGARYYMSDVSVWLSVDPMWDKYPNISPFNYCHWNPVMLTDPDGRDDGWVEDPTNKSKGVYWNPKVNSPAEAQTAGVKYHGQTVWGTDKDGNTHFGDATGQWNDQRSLETTSYNGFRGDGAVSRAMEKSMNQGYDPNWINSFSDCTVLPDYMAISLSGNLIVGGGFGGSITLGYVKGDGGFLNASSNQGVGLDVSFGVSISAGNYMGVGDPTATSLSGASTYQNFGSTVNVTSFQDVSSNNGKLRLGDYWQGGSLNVSFGSKSVWGGSAGTSLTTKPLMLW